MGNPSLHSIHVHPLKAARGFAPEEAVVEPWGLAGDRRWVLVDGSGKVITQRPHPRMTLAAAGRGAPRRGAGVGRPRPPRPPPPPGPPPPPAG
ncbi:MOSC N-terminal beta barrel domain-containing protein, partial [Streptomyces bottropensis]|uniref:MOSC N-terminal beta barrel domain-containing protein n=1 Tax=Streptomyces bottropensis TaxID=42235 RepID=UPI00369DEDFE